MNTLPIVYESNPVGTDHVPSAPFLPTIAEIHWAGYEYYALFDAQGRLLSCAGWQHFLQGPQVHNPGFLRSVANDAAYHQPVYIVTGPLAGLLWTAWHGRLRDQEPHHATAQTAIAARTMIHLAPPSPARDLVLRALDHLGPNYWPWHQSTKLDDRAHVIWHDPDYERLDPIPPEMMQMLP